MAEQKKFVLYEYLTFFWRKKIFFLIIPILFTFIGFGGSYLLPKEGEFVGNATVFTGSVKLKALTNPVNIVAQYGDDVKGKVDAYVSSDSYIKLKVYGDNKEDIEHDLRLMTSGVEKSLLENYDLRFSITETTIKNHEKYLLELQDVLKVTNEKLAQRDLTIDKVKEITSTLEKTEAEIAEIEAKNQRMLGDLAFFEKPSIIPQGVKEVDQYKLEFSVAGLIVGIFATFLILMLWKYIEEARRFNQHD